jgi:hypothetical protein
MQTIPLPSNINERKTDQPYLKDSRIRFWNGKRLLCEHKRYTDVCVDCKGTNICIHDHRKSRCIRDQLYVIIIE